MKAVLCKQALKEESLYCLILDAFCTQNCRGKVDLCSNGIQFLMMVSGNLVLLSFRCTDMIKQEEGKEIPFNLIFLTQFYNLSSRIKSILLHLMFLHKLGLRKI